jgi:Potential Queuosine, Q, salvage protein family
MPDVLDGIRSACAAVSGQARWVAIAHDRLDTYAAQLAPALIHTHGGDPGRQRAGDDEATAAFVIALDAINFGSGYFPYLRKRPGMSGYFTVATSLRDHVDSTGPLTAPRLCALTPADCAVIFGQRLDGGWQQELMTYFATALNALGADVRERYDGSFLTLVAAAEHSAARLVTLLDRQPYFHDVSRYRGLDVPLYKRAQITAYDVAEAFSQRGPGRFDDLDRLTMFADNLVPHVLRLDGVLDFDHELVARIERVDDITAGSEPEVEIRAVALHAVELLVVRLRAMGHSTSAAQLDALLWNRGGSPAYKAVARHRTRTVFY